jgi:recombination protein RecA
LNLSKISAEVERAIMAKKEKKERAERLDDKIFFPTGSDLLDLVIGGGVGMGIPGGRIINVVGNKSAGKTFIACEIIAAARFLFKSRLKWEFDDSESGFTFNTKGLYGFEIMPENPDDRVHSETVEELYCNVRKFLDSLKSDEVGIYVVDSLDGLTSEEQDTRADKRYAKFKQGEEFDEKSYQMGKAKYLSQEFFPQLADYIQDKNALLIIISQIRDNPDPYSHKEYVRAGGRAMDFYCHSVLFLTMITPILKKKRAVGVVLKAKTTKSKTPRPYRDAIISLLFDYGIDNIGSNLDFLYDLRGDSGALLNKAEKIIWDGKKVTKDSLKDFLEEMDVNLKDLKKLKKLDDYIEYIDNHSELQSEFEKRFGTSMKRDELINYIEEHGLTSKLKEKVIAKWEEIEESIKVRRQPKYID